MALIRCRECGQVISDRAVSCPNCGCPVGRPAMQPQERPYPPYQPVEKKSNKWLYFIIGILLALTLGGTVLLISLLNSDKKSQVAKVQVDKDDVKSTDKDAAKDQSKQDKTVNTVSKENAAKPAPPPQPVKETYTAPPSSNIVMTGILNGDDVTFVLKSSGSSVSGQFYNKTINVAFTVKGTLTSSSMNLRSVNHGKWRFVASKSGGVYRGYAYNGSVTYDMEVL